MSDLADRPERWADLARLSAELESAGPWDSATCAVFAARLAEATERIRLLEAVARAAALVPETHADPGAVRRLKRAVAALDAKGEQA